MKKQIAEKIAEELAKLNINIASKSIEVEHPKIMEHGDYSSNIAMALAKQEKTSPRKIAESLVSALKHHEDFFEKIEIAGPGFINFFLKASAYHEALKNIWDENEKLILPDIGEGKKVLIEFLSANPTGPMHVGHGRNAVVGDVMARLLQKVGYEVTREFYINDHGVQIRTLGRSGQYYYKRLKGEISEIELADDVYRGEYLEELVKKLKDEIGPLVGDTLSIGKLLGEHLLEKIKLELERLHIKFDRYYSESSLYSKGKIDEMFEKFKDYTYESEGALWFNSSHFGDDKDRVLRKKDGSLTYFAPDIAYHLDKFERNFDFYINVFGADHGGYIQRMRAAILALGYDADRLEFILMQMVNLKRGNEKVGMSKRSGAYVTLGEVIDEVGADATRFFFMMRSHQTTLDFDLELAKKTSAENPVYYLQYAHARICSIFKKLETQKEYSFSDQSEQMDLSSLDLPEELEMIKLIITYPDVLMQAALQREPHRLGFYLLEVAKVFQNYYTRGKTDSRYRVLEGDVQNVQAKLYLLKALKDVLKLGFKILGVSAPEYMEAPESE